MSPLRPIQTLVSAEIQYWLDLVRSQWRRNPLPLQLFCLLMLNLAIAPGVAAATGPEITRKAAYALAILGSVIFGLALYLFVVIFQPERF